MTQVEPKKKRGRPKQVIEGAERIGEEIKVLEQAPADEPESIVATAEDVVGEQLGIIEQSIDGENSDFIQEEHEYYITRHKYKIGDIIWYPDYTILPNTDIYGVIAPKYGRVAKKGTISSVVVTNKVCYTIKENAKLTISELYLTDTKEDCDKLCAEMNK
jgi:hypothetical protein